MLRTGNESAPIQLAQCRFPGLAISSANLLEYFFSNETYGSNFVNGTRKLLWFEITDMLIAFLKKIIVLLRNDRYCVERGVKLYSNQMCHLL